MVHGVVQLDKDAAAPLSDLSAIVGVLAIQEVLFREELDRGAWSDCQSCSVCHGIVEFVFIGFGEHSDVHWPTRQSVTQIRTLQTSRVLMEVRGKSYNRGVSSWTVEHSAHSLSQEMRGYHDIAVQNKGIGCWVAAKSVPEPHVVPTTIAQIFPRLDEGKASATLCCLCALCNARPSALLVGNRSIYRGNIRSVRLFVCR